MIVVFVIDTSPSMGTHIGDSGMSRLDVAKMATEEIVKGLKRRLQVHNSEMQQSPPKVQESFRNIGLGFMPKDDLLLLSTARQYTSHPSTAACAAGGRLLVGFDYLTNENNVNGNNTSSAVEQQYPHGIDAFQRELKNLKASDWTPPTRQQQQMGKKVMFPEDGGGIVGLNAALSAGLNMMSRYRLRYRTTENYAMGRLPSPAVLNPSTGGTSLHALQPACLVLITDAECLRVSEPGGGALELSSNSLLKESYHEPYRWDQRVFILGVSDKDKPIPNQLRALSEVTGGSCFVVERSTIAQTSDLLVKLMAPPRPRLPVQDPIAYPPINTNSIKNFHGSFVQAGPICQIQSFGDLDSGLSKHRAMLLYVPHLTGCVATGDDIGVFQSPIYPISESFFPNKKLDTLPPRPAQPLLMFSRHPSQLGSKSFEASSVMKILQKLDQLTLANRKIIAPNTSIATQQSWLLKRDVVSFGFSLSSGCDHLR
jgi:integrator complex subunit 6